MVPIAHMYREYSTRPDLLRSSLLLFRTAKRSSVVVPCGVVAITYDRDALPDDSTVYQLVLSDARVCDLPAARNSSAPEVWLRRHLLLRKLKGSGLVEVVAIGRSDSIEPSDVALIHEVTVNALRSLAMQTGHRADVIEDTISGPR
jgi:hypothetical protein